MFIPLCLILFNFRPYNTHFLIIVLTNASNPMKKLLLLAASLFLVASAFAQWPATFGPDLYGYTGQSFNNQDPRYEFVDIFTTGTKVNGLADDNFVGPFDFGFDFQYYWLKRDEIYVGSNGYLSFGKGFNYGSIAGGFPQMPNASDVKHEMIAPFLSDLSFATPNPAFPNPGEVYFYTNNVDTAIIAYYNVPFWVNTAEDVAQWRGSNTFEVIFNKADSSVKFIYLVQDGSYSSSYDPDPADPFPASAPVVVGIENVSGTIGLSINQDVPATQLLPTANTGVVWKHPVTPGIDIDDVEVDNIQNSESAGFFLPVPGSSFFVDADLNNVGSTDITSNIVVDAEIRVGGAPFYVDQQTFSGINQAASQNFTFGPPLVLTTPGSFEFNVTVSNADDDNPSNDVKIVEVNALDTVGGTTKFGYTTFDDRSGVDQAVIWASGSGNSGAGMYVAPYAYPTVFTGVEVFLMPSVFLDQVGQPTINLDTIPDGGYRIQVYREDPAGGIPGNLLLLDTIITKNNVDIAGPNDGNGNILLGDWNQVDFPDPIVVPNGGLYVSWYHLNDSLQMGGESTLPISRRMFEVLDGSWAPHRNRDTEDYGMRLIADVSGIYPDGVEAELDVFNAFNVYPNPATDNITIEAEFSEITNATVQLFDLSGAKLFFDYVSATTAFNKEWNVSNLAPGMYILQVDTPVGSQSKKITIQ